MHRLKISPSETLNMSLGEIYAILWAVQDELSTGDDDKAELYTALKEIRAKERADDERFKSQDSG